MDDAEIEYLQEELVDLFQKFQKVVDDFAIYRITANRKRRPENIREEDAKASDYFVPIEWHQEVWRIQRSLEFLNLAGHLEFYRRRCLGGVNSTLPGRSFDSSTTPISPGQSYSGARSSDVWVELDQDHEDDCTDYSHFGNWCILSGYFFAKLCKHDLSDWTPQFKETLKQMPTKLGELRIILGLGVLPEDVTFRTYKAVPMDKKTEIAISNFRALYAEDPDVIDYSVHYNSLNRSDEVIEELYGRIAENRNGEKFPVYSGIQIHLPFLRLHKDCKCFEKRIQLAELDKLSLGDFWSYETEILQLCCYLKYRPDFRAIVSTTFLDDIFIVKSMNHNDANALELADVKNKLRKLNSLLGHKMDVAETSRPVGLLFDYLLEKKAHFEQFRLMNAVRLFDKACSLSNPAIEYVLYASVLESVLTNGSGGETKARIASRLSGMIADPLDASAREHCENRIASIYQRRNDIVHGKDTGLIDAPFRNIQESVDSTMSIDWVCEGVRLQNEIRSVCRRAILTSFFVLHRLKLDRLTRAASPITRYLNREEQRIASTTGELILCMEVNNKEPDFWAALQSTAALEIASIGLTQPQVFNDESLFK